MKGIRFYPVSDSWCPTCRAPEVDPQESRLFIRGFKVYDEDGTVWSQCLVCAGYYHRYEDGRLEYREAEGDPAAGWFCE